MPQINIEEKNEIIIMHLVGDFNDEDDNDKLLDTFKKLGKQNVKKLLVDLTEVFYLNSRALGVLLSGNSLITKNGGKFILFGANDYMDNIFKITKIAMTLPVFKTYPEALEEVSK